MPIVYLEVRDVLLARHIALRFSESQDTPARDIGMVASVLQHIQNDDYYPTFETKLTHLFFSLIQLHCFPDGNKRTALSATYFMLQMNEYVCASSFLFDMQEVVVMVAEGVIGKDLLHDILVAEINLQFHDDEGLKLRILEARMAHATRQSTIARE